MKHLKCGKGSILLQFCRRSHSRFNRCLAVACHSIPCNQHPKYLQSLLPTIHAVTCCRYPLSIHFHAVTSKGFLLCVRKGGIDVELRKYSHRGSATSLVILRNHFLDFQPSCHCSDHKASSLPPREWMPWGLCCDRACQTNSSVGGGRWTPAVAVKLASSCLMTVSGVRTSPRSAVFSSYYIGSLSSFFTENYRKLGSLSLGHCFVFASWASWMWWLSDERKYSQTHL